MIPPAFTVELHDERLLLHFEKLPTTLRTNLRSTITSLTNALLGQVRAAEPSRTGLLRSQTRAFVDESNTSIKGRVRVLHTPGTAHNVAAAALEYGVHRSFGVKAYERGSIAVRAYERTANIAERRFLRGPAEAMKARALAELQAAVTKSLQGA